MSDLKEYDIAIIGGGFSAACLLLHLSQCSPNPSSVVVIHPSDEIGRGIAYSTPYGYHLLNVPAKNMSLFEDKPNHFLEWLGSHHPSLQQPNTFAPRRIYGDYITHNLIQSLSLPFIHQLNATVVKIRHQRASLIETTNGNLIARKVFFAMGNALPCPFPISNMPGEPLYINNPWQFSLLEQIDPQMNVAIIGSGLTMVDIVLKLVHQQHQGKIVALSRHGYQPQPHSSPPSNPLHWLDTPQSLKQLVRQVNQLRHQHSDWRKVIDGLRPLTQSCWLHFTPQEKNRFLRHCRSLWDIHRHRIAPSIASTIQQVQKSAQLVIQPARIRAINYNDRFNISYRHKGKESTCMSDIFINATGPSFAQQRRASQLINQIAQDYPQCLDDMQLGFVRYYQPHQWYFIGPLTKGEVFENIAVPDIRKQINNMINSDF